MHVIVFVVIGVVRIESRGVKLHLGLAGGANAGRCGFVTGFVGVKQCFLNGQRLRRLLCFLGVVRPVVGVAANGHDDFPRGHFLHHLPQVFNVPVLGSNGTRGRGLPVLVVVHQHDGVALLGKEFVIVGIVARGEGHHELQAHGMQRRFKLGGELPEVRLAGVGNFFEVDDNAGLVEFHRELHRVVHESLAGLGARQQFGHFLDAPLETIVVVEQTHDRKLDGGIERLHPLVQLVLFEQGDAFRRRSLDAILAVLVIHDSQRAIRRDGVQLLRNEKVDLPVMLLQRGETVGIPTDEKGGTQGIVTGRHSAEVGDAAVAPFARRKGLLFRFERMVAGFCIGQQPCGQLDADGDGHEEIRQQHREQCSGNLQDAASAAPAHTLRVVKDGTAFLHESLQPGGMAGKSTPCWVESFRAIPSALL